MRYAANRPAVAARERFAARTISEADGQLWLVQISLSERVLALTHQANLDTLGLDDRVSTGRIDMSSRIDPDPLLDTCGHLGDAVYDWWNGFPPPLLYRSRTTPGVSQHRLHPYGAMVGHRGTPAPTSPQPPHLSRTPGRVHRPSQLVRMTNAENAILQYDVAFADAGGLLTLCVQSRTSRIRADADKQKSLLIGGARSPANYTGR